MAATQAFLSLVSYYRRFIKDFSKVAMPLHGLLVGHPKKESRKISAILRQWTPECDIAFHRLKQALNEAPFLAFADFSLLFTLYTDASNRGLGAVLAQTQGDIIHHHIIRSRFFWPKQSQDVQAWCVSCPWCILRKTPVVTTQAPLLSITTTCPLELVAMDFLKLPLSTDGHQYVLVVTDHFTKYSWTIPTRHHCQCPVEACWHPRLPLDVTLGTASEPPPPQIDRVRTHHQKLSFAHQKAAEKLEVARQHQKRAHDRCPLSSPLLPGERVLLRQRVSLCQRHDRLDQRTQQPMLGLQPQQSQPQCSGPLAIRQKLSPGSTSHQSP
ncbi:hypothetical protein AAFF_G00051180 [Aldrovandia affinis]|uniref:Gypsy retrotransposon integrase-like protein 1 n=1 Tax=Aldrovandia affinis TaxID=143900 RepID=A0AAD7T4N0_9TELE|nr:hypothetical protein AAFF_G00051180 [Aldrovandia affinis]